MKNGYASREAKTGRMLFVRLEPGTDLLAGILEACAYNSIKYATISTVIGSLSGAKFVYAVPDNEGKLGIRYSQPVEVEGPLEFIGGQGVIGVSDKEEAMIHFHGIVSDKDMKVYAGHFVEGGNPVLATIEAAVQELENIRLVRSYDEETEFPLFKPYE